jgi:transposase-like protein
MRQETSDPRLGDFWVQYEPANLVDWDVFRVPETFTAGFLAEPFRILIEIVLEDDGPQCVAVSRLDYDAPPLTSERRFPLRAMVNAAVRTAAFELVDVPIEQADPKRENPRLVPDERGHVQVYAPAFGDQERLAAPARRSGSEADLSRVAELYRRAAASGFAPSSVIAEEFGITPATARKWVQRARVRGFLGAALGRRVGEAGRRTAAS